MYPKRTFANVNIKRDDGFSDDGDIDFHQKSLSDYNTDNSRSLNVDNTSDFGNDSIGQQMPRNTNYNNYRETSFESEVASEHSFGGESEGRPVSDVASDVSSYVGSDLSPEEEMKKKRFILFKLKRYQKQGYELNRMYNINTPLEDLQAEYESIRKESTLNQGLKVSKNILISTCSALEYLNNRFDPVDVVLEGWSEDVAEDVETGDYDEVLEELYDKYYDKVNVGPEMKLLMMIGGSAVKFHISNTLLKAMVPNSETLLKQNPGLKDDIMNLVNQKTPQMQQVNTAINNSHIGNVGGLGKQSSYQFQGPDDADDILRELEMDADNEDNKVFEMDF